MNPSLSPGPSPALVLDTNATLDWLLFGDAGMDAVAAAIGSGKARWLATPRMREELLRTLSYPSLAGWKPDCERTLSRFDRWACMESEPTPMRREGLHCTDPDDQVFMDLALARQARWLITHDRALHRLARPAARHGLLVVRPRDWSGQPAS